MEPSCTRSSGRGRLRGAAVAAVAVVVVASLGWWHADAAVLADLGVRPLLLADGDLVVFGPSDAGAGAGSGAESGVYDPRAATGAPTGNGTVLHDGFATYADATSLGRYEIHLVDSPGIEAYRALVERAARAASDAGGPALTVVAGRFRAQAEPPPGVIDVVVAESAPCAGAWLGCGGPTIDHGVVVAGQMWFNPRLAGRAPSEIDNTVRHELGHALGLAHFPWLFDGRVQTMHPTRFDADRYETGDQSGLRFLTGAAAGAGAAPAPPAAPDDPISPSPAPAPLDPVGAIVDAVANPFGLVINGWATDPASTAPAPVVVSVDGATDDLVADRATDAHGPHGFALVWLVPPGSHEVCVQVRTVAGDREISLGCRRVEVSPESISRVGLQTV